VDRDVPAGRARGSQVDLHGNDLAAEHRGQDLSGDAADPGAGEGARGRFPIDAWSVEVFSQLFYGRTPARNRDRIATVKREGLRRWGRWAWMAFFYVVQDLPALSASLGVELRRQ
jgi:hypothetical protein